VFLEGGNENDRTFISVNTVGPRYFETMGIPLLRGRSLGEEDRPGGTKAVVVNETMARKFWPNDDAVGKRFRFFGDDEPWAVIAGVARDSKYGFLGAPRATPRPCSGRWRGRSRPWIPTCP